MALTRESELTCEVAIIGGGLSGITAGVYLQRAGIEDYVVLERSSELGGTWRDNRYPGVAVDIPSVAYQFRFDRNPRWSRIFAPGAEVQQYHLEVANKYGVREHCVFGADVVAETWDEDNNWWHLELAGGGAVTARFVISAVGPFLSPKRVGNGIPGFDDFSGDVLVPAAWPEGYDLKGKRVAVIGTGATGVQLAGSIAPEVGSMKVFQRTPVYCVPKPDLEVPSWAQRLLGIPGVGVTIDAVARGGASVGLYILTRAPGIIMRPAMRIFDRVCRTLYRRYLRRIVLDRETADRLTPEFGLFGNRPTLNSTFPRAFNRPGVDLVTERIDRVVPDGVRTRDGQVHKFDCIISATGWELFSEPASYPDGRVVGVGGNDLGRWWAKHGMQAYESVAVPGFPNRWIIVGPYSWTGTGWHSLAENAVVHAVRAIGLARAQDAVRMEVTSAALSAFMELMRHNGRHLRYYFTELNKGVNSYWVNKAGEIPILRPTTLRAARKASESFPLDDYLLEQAL